MSSFEYMDLYKKCQDKGIYHMFTFDLKGSKNMEKEELIDAEEKLRKVVIDVYNKLKTLEIISNKKILLEKNLYKDEHWMKDEPFFLGDAAGISIYRNSISEEKFMEIFNNSKTTYDFNYELNIANGYYETTKWEEGDKLFSRSYCFELLSNIHKINKEVSKKR